MVDRSKVRRARRSGLEHEGEPKPQRRAGFSIGGSIGWIVRIVVLLGMTVFWFFFGLAIQIRIAVIAASIYSAQAVASPFTSNPEEAGERATQHFERSLGVWEAGFRAILKFFAGTKTSTELTDELPFKSLMGALGKLLLQSAWLVLFYVPILSTMYWVGWLPSDRLDRMFGRSRPPLESTRHPVVIAGEAGQQCQETEKASARPASKRYRATIHLTPRRGPGWAFEEIGELDKGSIVTVKGQTGDGKWALVEKDGRPICFVPTDSLVAISR